MLAGVLWLGVTCVLRGAGESVRRAEEGKGGKERVKENEGRRKSLLFSLTTRVLLPFLLTPCAAALINFRTCNKSNQRSVKKANPPKKFGSNILGVLFGLCSPRFLLLGPLLCL